VKPPNHSSYNGSITLNDERQTALSWPSALLRALSPVRCSLCLLGLAVTLLACALAEGMFGDHAVPAETWWRAPLTGLHQLGNEWFTDYPGTAIFRCLTLAAVLSLPWSVIGGWIARAELLAQRAGRESELAPVQASPTPFVQGRALSLFTPLLFVVFFVFCVLLLVVPFGWANLLLGDGIGALLVALLLPLLMLLQLMITVVLVGSISYSIMPATVAAEGTDAFDAISRGYSYFYQEPVWFAFWWGLSAVLAALPWAAVHWLTEPFELRPLVELAAATLGLSVFWSMQPLVYVKLRRCVDETPEDEIWDDSPSPTTGATKPATVNASGEVQPNAEEAAPTLRTAPLTFRDTLYLQKTRGLGQSRGLFIGTLWAVAVLAGCVLVILTRADGEGGWMARFPAAVGKLDPGTLLALVAGAIFLGAVGLAWPIKAAVRVVAVYTLFENRTLPFRAAWPFASRTWGQGLVSVLFVAIGVELYLTAAAWSLVALDGKGDWQDVVTLAALAVVCLGVGAFGLGAVAVRGDDPDAEPVGGLSAFLGAAPQVLASAGGILILGTQRFLTLTGLAGLTWLLTCATLSWWGGDQTGWIRWGLSGTQPPEANGGLYPAASWIAGFWFLLLVSFILTYPLATALRWGTICYLLARQQGDEGRLPPLTLSEEERAALVAPLKSKRASASRPTNGEPGA
jgi:hypothetical protein